LTVIETNRPLAGASARLAVVKKPGQVFLSRRITDHVDCGHQVEPTVQRGVAGRVGMSGVTLQVFHVLRVVVCACSLKHPVGDVDPDYSCGTLLSELASIQPRTAAEVQDCQTGDVTESQAHRGKL
jgi:hypothetical protein